MIGHALSNQPSQQPLSFVNNLLAHNHASITRMCANKSALTSPRRFNPFPFLNPAISAMAYSATGNEESTTLSPDNFSRYSKFLVKNSNGVDGMGGLLSDRGEQNESILWLDTLAQDVHLGNIHDGFESTASNTAPRPFSVLSWNILAQTLYEGQYQRRRIQQVALSTQPSLSSSPHPHPWPKRLKRIVEILSHSNSDIICLQECELQSFKNDLVPALHKFGYDGIAQEDDRLDKPVPLKEASKHRDARNHIVATFWKRDKFEPVGDASVRTRTLTTVLRLKGNDEVDEDRKVNGESKEKPTVAVVNVHLEGHPRRFAERTHQLQHAMTDLSKKIEHERTDPSSQIDNSDTIGKLNALVLTGDFNCELQSSACSTYMRMGRIGRQAGLGGVHGTSALAVPPCLLETTEATEAIHPIIEWGRALPEEAMADMDPHPFRRNGMTSAYPAWLGKDDARSHFTFCSELSKVPVPGLDQIWFSSMTLDRMGLRRMFVDDSGIWERYFYDDVEVEKRRDEERRKVLVSGLPSLECEYPSDHLPIGASFEFKWDDCGESCLLDENIDADQRLEEVRELNVVDSEGNDVQDDASLDKLMQEKEKMQQEHCFENPHDELEYLINFCPYDSEEQQSDVRFILSPLDPPLDVTSKERKRPSPDQLEQLDVRRAKKADCSSSASLGVRPWLKKVWKAEKMIGKWDRQKLIAEARRKEKAEAGEEN